MEVAHTTDERGKGFHALTRPQLIGTMVGLVLTLLLSALDQTIVGTAMPRIIAQLNGFERYAWVTTVYLLSSTITVPIIGKLSDMYGRKYFLLTGAIVFVAASALCGASGDLPLPIDGMNQLILFRGIQGIGGGMIAGIVFAVIGDIFPPAERGKVQGVFAGVFGISSVIGPALGGWITDNLSWRWVFYVNLPVGLLAIAALFIAFPYFAPEGGKRLIDWWGVATLIASMVPILLALTWVATYGWGSARVLGFLAFGFVMLAVFIFAESRAAEPILDLKLFQNRIFSVSALALFMTGMGMFGAIIFIPLFMQGVLDVSATASGSLLTPMMLALIVGSAVSGQIISRLGRYKILALVGLAIMTGGLLLLGAMRIDTTTATVVRNMIVVGLGLGLTMPIYTIAVQNSVDRRMLGAATAATQFFRQIGGTVGTAIFTSLMLSRYHQHFAEGVPSGTPTQALVAFDNPLQLAQIKPLLEQQFGAQPGGAALLQLLLGNSKEALYYAIQASFFLGAALVAVSFIANFFLKEIPLRKGFDDKAAQVLDAAVPNATMAPGQAVQAASQGQGAVLRRADEQAD
jgi:EmrB/QacA subfamily drug resistance transporter